MKKYVPILLSLFVLLLAACGGQETGELEFRANGEDFVRQGFVSKDGWAITFDHVYVTLEDIAAYQTDPPYDSASGVAPEGEIVAIDGTYTLDLADGGEDADPILISSVADAPAGQYNAVGWRMVPAASGPSEGYTVHLEGVAEKDGQTIPFGIQVANEFVYNCGEYVGDERKGILSADTTTDVELTFHFDHIFGDADAPMDDALNVGALGFGPLAALAQDGQLMIDSAGLQSGLSDADFATFVDTVQTLGHVGEGHCFEAEGGYTGHSSE
jgi:hypothetical protein